MKNIILLLLVILVFACSSDTKEKEKEKTEESKTDPLFISDERWGSISDSTDYASLKKDYGESALADSTIFGPEGIDTLNVTYVYPATDKEFIVHWKDKLHHREIGFIETYQPASPYKTHHGLKIGSTLKEMLTINKKPIQFSGFGWDYGGYVMSYRGGALDSSQISYRLDGGQGLPDGLLGDAEFSTEMPLVKSALDSIRIYSIMLSFYDR